MLPRCIKKNKRTIYSVKDQRQYIKRTSETHECIVCNKSTDPVKVASNRNRARSHISNKVRSSFYIPPRTTPSFVPDAPAVADAVHWAHQPFPCCLSPQLMRSVPAAVSAI